MREIGKDGKVWRLTKESWDILKPFDSDPNEAVRRMRDRIIELQKGAPISQSDGGRFDEKKLRAIIKESLEAAIAPYIGG